MEKGQKFSLGAALLFEDLTGKRMADISDGLGLRETIALLYCQRFWNIKERPSLDQFTEEISASNIEALSGAVAVPQYGA